VVSKSAAETAPASKLLVHVVGEVAKPGVVELPAGSRVTEAIDAAGGVTPKAELGALNLARVLTDGEQLVVPNTDQAAAGVQTSQTPSPGGASGAESATAGALVNLNTADAAQLEALPRIGPALAQRIVEWREANGPFVNVDQLMEVSGVGTKIFEGLKSEVTV
jgi:competence protein ComEA